MRREFPPSLVLQATGANKSLWFCHCAIMIVSEDSGIWLSGSMVIAVVLWFTAIAFLWRYDLRPEPSVQCALLFHFIAHGAFLDAVDDLLVAFLFLCHCILYNEVRRAG